MVEAKSIWVGAFYNPHLAPEILALGDAIDHLAMADPPDERDEYFAEIRKRYVLLLHDYIGQLSDPIPPHALNRARKLANLYQSPWIAEHFQCVVSSDGRYNVDYVFPPLYTEEFLQCYIQNACDLQSQVDLPLVIENIPRYFETTLDEMTEGEFLRRFFETSGAAFLLDIAHAWLGAYYRGRPARDCLSQLPLELVMELHIAGTSVYGDLNGPWIAPVEPSDEILDLAAWAMERMPRLKAVTFDAFSTIMKRGTIPRTIERIRKRLQLS